MFKFTLLYSTITHVSVSRSTACPMMPLCSLRCCRRLAVCCAAVWLQTAWRTWAWSPDPSCSRCCCCVGSSRRRRRAQGGSTGTTTAWSPASSLWAAPASDPSSKLSTETRTGKLRLQYGRSIMPDTILTVKGLKDKYKRFWQVKLVFLYHLLKIQQVKTMTFNLLLLNLNVKMKRYYTVLYYTVIIVQVKTIMTDVCVKF